MIATNIIKGKLQYVKKVITVDMVFSDVIECLVRFIKMGFQILLIRFPLNTVHSA